MSDAAQPSHRDRLGVARCRIAQLAQDEAAWLAGHPFRLLHEQDMRAGRYQVRVRATQPLPVELVGGVAESIAALRDALDAVLIAAGGIGRFPVTESLPQFAQRARKAISPMGDEAQAAAEGLQPYHAIGGFRNGPLWVLDQLYRADGPLLAAGALAEGAEMGVNTRRKVEVSGAPRIAAGPFDDGAVVAEETFRIVGSDPKLDMYFRATFVNAFSRAGPARGQPAVPLLGALALHLEGEVFPAMEGSIVGR